MTGLKYPETDRLHFSFLLSSVPRLPWGTISLLAFSWLIYCFTGGLYNCPLWTTAAECDALQLAFHPVLHQSLGHLAFNTVLGLTAGTLLEVWTTLRRRNLLAIFIICYLSSLVSAYVNWNYLGPNFAPVQGFSGMISAIVPFLMFYSLLFCKEISFKRSSLLASFGIGVLFWWVTGPLFDWIFVTKTWDYTELGDSSLIHLVAFGAAILPALLLMRLIRRRTTLQESPLRI